MRTEKYRNDMVNIYSVQSQSLPPHRLINRFEEFLCQTKQEEKRLQYRPGRCSGALSLPQINMKYGGVLGLLIQLSLSSVRPDQTSDLTKFVPLDVSIGDGAQSTKLQVLLSGAVLCEVLR